MFCATIVHVNWYDGSILNKRTGAKIFAIQLLNELQFAQWSSFAEQNSNKVLDPQACCYDKQLRLLHKN